MLGIPPYGPCSTVREDDDGGVRALDRRCSVGVVFELSRVLVERVPAVDDERGRTRTHAADLIVQSLELLRDRLVGAAELPATAEPCCRPIGAADFATVGIG